MRNIYRLKHSFFSFLGGIIGSFALTVLYESIDSIGNKNVSCVSSISQWMSAIILGVSCVCFLCLSINLDAINEKYALLMTNSVNDDDDVAEIWKRAIRIVVEMRLKSYGDNAYKSDSHLIIDKQKKLSQTLDIQCIGGSVLLFLGTVLLLVSKVF